MSVEEVLKLLNLLTGQGLRIAEAVMRLSSLIEEAQRTGEPIPQEELDKLAAETDDAVDKAVEKLREAAQR